MNCLDPSSGTIFISVAAYRDPETVFTIKDILVKAQCPHLITVGVLWQVEENDYENKLVPRLPELSKILGDRVKIMEVDAADAKGPSWARYMIQKHMYGTEDFYLQIDSHTRFIDGWDVTLKQLWHRCGHDMAIVTTYPSEYTNDNFDYTSITLPVHDGSTDLFKCLQKIDEQDKAVFRRHSTPTVLCVDQEKGFDSHGMVRLTARSVKTGIGGLVQHHTGKPPKSLFWAAGFSFSRAHVIAQAPYEEWPALFFGEEFAMACKMFRAGYSFYTPDRAVMYHLWDRSYRNVYTPVGSQPDEHLRAESQQRVMDILTKESADEGWRSLEEFQKYCGVDFNQRTCKNRAYRGGFDESAFACNDSSAAIVASVLGNAVRTESDQQQQSMIAQRQNRKNLAAGAATINSADPDNNTSDQLPYQVLDKILMMASLDGTAAGGFPGMAQQGPSPMSPTATLGVPPTVMSLSELMGIDNSPSENQQGGDMGVTQTLQVKLDEQLIGGQVSLARAFNFESFNKHGFVVIDNFARLVGQIDFLKFIVYLRDTIPLRPAQMGSGTSETFSNTSLRGDLMAFLPEFFPAVPKLGDSASELMENIKPTI